MRSITDDVINFLLPPGGSVEPGSLASKNASVAQDRASVGALAGVPS